MYLYKCLCKYTFTYFCMYDGWMLMMMVCGDICHATILRMLIHKMHTYIYKHMDDDDDGMRGHLPNSYIENAHTQKLHIYMYKCMDDDDDGMRDGRHTESNWRGGERGISECNHQECRHITFRCDALCFYKEYNSLRTLRRSNSTTSKKLKYIS